MRHTTLIAKFWCDSRQHVNNPRCQAFMKIIHALDKVSQVAVFHNFFNQILNQECNKSICADAQSIMPFKARSIALPSKVLFTNKTPFPRARDNGSPHIRSKPATAFAPRVHPTHRHHRTPLLPSILYRVTSPSWMLSGSPARL